MAHSYEGLTCVITGLPLEPGDVVIHAGDEVYGVKADVWRNMGKDERRHLRDALVPTESAPAARESKRGGDGVPPADNQQGS